MPLNLNPSNGAPPNQTNKQDLQKSISYALYFNFQNPNYYDRQIRVSSADLQAYMSPDFSARPEFVFDPKTGNVNYDSTGFQWNEIHAKVPITRDFLSYIPHHARQIILRWIRARTLRLKQYEQESFKKAKELYDANSKEKNYDTAFTWYLWRTNSQKSIQEATLKGDFHPYSKYAFSRPDYFRDRLMNFLENLMDINSSIKLSDREKPVFTIPDELASLQAVTYMTPTPPFYDILKPYTPDMSEAYQKAYSELKLQVMNKMAQLYYDANGGTKRMERIYDVYQLGNTIFDVRFLSSREVNQEIIRQISKLTSDYLAMRDAPMSDEDAFRLENNYNTQISQLYEQQESALRDDPQDCGTMARYIRITVPAGQQLRISQVQAIDNRAENVAFGMPATAASATLFQGEARDETTGTTNEKEGAKNYNKAQKAYKALLVTDGVYEPRSQPSIYVSEVADTAGLTVDLGVEHDITTVILTFPEGEMNTTNYTITLLDVNKKAPKLAANQRSTAAGAGPTFDFRRSGAAATCPTGRSTRVKVARFFATIQGSGLCTEQQIPCINNITFTSYAEGIDAALTFNKDFNCGMFFPIERAGVTALGAEVVPRISYSLNSLNITTLSASDPATVRRILKDHYLSITTPEFKARADITGQSVYDSNYQYTIDRINETRQVGPFTVAIHWQEWALNPGTGAKVNPTPTARFGIFYYIKNTENWNDPNPLYDVRSSRLYPSRAALDAAIPSTATPGAWVAWPQTQPSSNLYPASVQLDNSSGACPATDCSDPAVIDSLVNSYNNWAGPKNKELIYRVTKAITPFPTQCHFAATMGFAADSTRQRETTVVMNTELERDTCRYKLQSIPANGLSQSDILTGNVPLLSRAYNYAVDTLAPVWKSFQSLFGELNAQGSALNTDLRGALRTYRTDTAAAYGQLEQLAGCPENSPDAEAKCSDPSILNQFLQYFQANEGTSGSKRVRRILRAGTATGVDCDFTVDTEVVGVNPADGSTTSAEPQTLGYRCRMQKNPAACNFQLTTDPYQLDEAYLVKPVTGPVTRDEGALICARLGSKLASPDQLAVTAADGGAWEGAGWVQADFEDLSGIVMRSNGTRDAVPPSKLANVVCWGQKPAQNSQSSAYEVVPFNSTRYYRKQFTPPLVCEPRIPIPPSDAQIRDTATQLTTASTDATLPAVGGKDIGAPLDPVDYVDCASPYALSQMARQGLTGQVTAVSAVGPTQCYVNGKLYTFSRPTGGELALQCTGVSIPAVAPGISRTIAPTSPPTSLGLGAGCTLNCDTAAAHAGLTNVAESRAVDTTTCEYRITTNRRLPFQATFRMAQFYTGPGGCTDLRLQSLRPSTEATSQFSLRLSPTDTALLDKFRDEWHKTYAVATDTQFRKRVGVVSEAAYDPATDAIVYKAEGADIGPFVYQAPGSTTPDLDIDVRAYYSARYYTVVFRAAADGSQFIYSMSERGDRPPLSFVAFTEANPTAVALRQPLAAMTKYRIFRVTVYGEAGMSTAELTRMEFRDAAGEYVKLPNAITQMADISGSYIKPLDKPCMGGYVMRDTPDPVTKFPICDIDTTRVPANRLAKLEYRKRDSGSACPIGYTQDTADSGLCKTTAYFNEVLMNSMSLLNANQFTPRLKFFLDPATGSGEGSQFTIFANEFIDLTGCNFRFMTGAAAAAPKAFKLEGSINGNYWKPLIPMRDIAYPAGMNKAFLVPEVYTFDGAAPTRPAAQSPAYSTTAAIPESFTNPVQPVALYSTPEPVLPRREPELSYVEHAKDVRLQDLYGLPLAATATRTAAYQELQAAPRRATLLRLTILDTVNSNSKFTHLSNFQLVTTDGADLPSASVQISNPQGIRNSPREGLQNLQRPGARWVDYAAEPVLLFQLAPTAAPIRGFRFVAPQLAANQAHTRFDALPAEWVFEKSGDGGRTWSPIHTMTDGKRAVYRAEFSPTYSFSELV